MDDDFGAGLTELAGKLRRGGVAQSQGGAAFLLRCKTCLERQRIFISEYEQLLSAARIVTGLNDWLSRDDVTEVAGLEWSVDTYKIMIGDYCVDDCWDINHAMTLDQCKDQYRRHVRSLRSIGDELDSDDAVRI